MPIFVPTSASIAANRTFCASHPIVLNARVTFTPTPSELMLLALFARISELFCARTSRSPLVAISLLTIYASAFDMIKLVAMIPPTATLLLWPPDSASAVASRFAIIVAFSEADTTSSPARITDVSIRALAPDLISLRTTRPPIAIPPDLSASESDEACPPTPRAVSSSTRRPVRSPPILMSQLPASEPSVTNTFTPRLAKVGPPSRAVAPSSAALICAKLADRSNALVV